MLCTMPLHSTDSRTAIRPQGIIAPDDVRAAVIALAKEKGEIGAARHLEMSRASIARVLGGLTVRRGTIALARARLLADSSAAPEMAK
jgi:hypothetical protein